MVLEREAVGVSSLGEQRFGLVLVVLDVEFVSPVRVAWERVHRVRQRPTDTRLDLVNDGLSINAESQRATNLVRTVHRRLVIGVANPWVF